VSSFFFLRSAKTPFDFFLLLKQAAGFFTRIDSPGGQNFLTNPLSLSTLATSGIWHPFSFSLDFF